MSITPDYILDASGLLCPEPVMLLHNRIRDIAVGETLQIQATDPSTERDIPRFCVFLGHELLEHTAVDGHYVYIIRKLASD
jgi:tRNA 2-thiouridine synthesizing protein A|tara:strand:- start:379 stop:621 length:243 start_codon:yes stop_codon:yes gene_type:complete